jgi:hypothetical protein
MLQVISTVSTFDADAGPDAELSPEPRGRKKRWADLTPPQKAGVVALGAVQLALLAVAATDLARRPAEQVRGPKWAWAPVLAVNFVGPLSYLVCGRRRG